MAYNKKLSGAQMVLVPITQVGENRFPYVENLRNRYIKFVDFCPSAYLPGTDASGLQANADMFVTFYDKNGTQRLIDSLPLERLDYSATNGVRQEIGYEISLENSFVICQDAAQIGKVAAFVFWYDLPEYSRRNTADNTITDNFAVKLTNATRYNQLPDEERMTNKRFRKLLVAAPSITPNYKTGVTAAQLQNLYLTLRKGSYLVADNVPLSLLRQLKMLEKSEWANIIFDFQSSYITIGGAGTIPNVNTDYIGKYVFFNVQYERE